MNKLLSSKVLVLSMLALVVGESKGTNQNPPLNNSQTNMPQQIVIDIQTDATKGYMSKKALAELRESPSYEWFKKKGVTSLEGIRKIYEEVQKYASLNIRWLSWVGARSKVDICTWLDLYWGELFPIFNRVEIRITNQPNYESCEKRKQKMLQEWSPGSSASFKWANQNNVDKQKDLLSVTFKAISLSGKSIDVDRYNKRVKSLLFEFLDDNWDVLQPFMGSALQQVQQPVLQNQLQIPQMQLQNQQQSQQTQETSIPSETVYNNDNEIFFDHLVELYSSDCYIFTNL